VASRWLSLGHVRANGSASGADRLNVLYTARVVSQAYPWIAQEERGSTKIRFALPLVLSRRAPSVAAILIRR
jgi:hypothetical protein